MSPASTQERASQIPVIAGIVLLTLLAWAYLFRLHGQMTGAMADAEAMRAMGMPMHHAWARADVWFAFVMWAVMMAGMMLPSAAPTLLVYGMVARRDDAAAAPLRIHLFAGGYLVMWTAFSAVATAVQWAFTSTGVLSPMMEIQAPAVAGALLVVAGLYQLTPLKRACLSACQSPAAFLVAHWRAGRAGAFRLGLVHGWYCLGCCWALMLLLFAGGVMNLAVIVGLTTFLLIEKLMPHAVQGGRVSGTLLVASGLYVALLR